MSTPDLAVPGRPSAVDQASTGVPGLLAAWRSLRWTELGWGLLAGLLYGVVDLSALQDLAPAQQSVSVVARHLVVPMACAFLLLLAWLPADRRPAEDPRRVAWLLLAVLLGSLVATALLTWLLHLFSWPHIGELIRRQKGGPVPDWHWRARSASAFISVEVLDRMMFLITGMALGCRLGAWTRTLEPSSSAMTVPRTRTWPSNGLPTPLSWTTGR